MEKIEEILRKNAVENRFMKYLGLEFLELSEEGGRGRIPYDKSLTNPYDSIHGGCLYALADIVAGTCACMAGNFATTVTGSMNYMLPAIGSDYIYCEANRLRKGKHLIVFEVKIKNEEGKILDSGEFTFFITEEKVVKE